MWCEEFHLASRRDLLLNAFYRLSHQNGRDLKFSTCSLVSEVGMNISKAEIAVLRCLDASVLNRTVLFSWVNIVNFLS